MKRVAVAPDPSFTLLIPRKPDEFLKEFIVRIEEIVKTLDDLPGKSYFYNFNESYADIPRFDMRLYFENEEDLLIAKLSL